MLTKLLEELRGISTLRPVQASQIQPTDRLVVHIFNDDPTNNNRLQIVDSATPAAAPGVPDYVNQNPTAFTSEEPKPDGIFVCLANSPKQTITCVGGTPSAYVGFEQGDVFDFTIGNTSYTNKTFSEMQTILESSDIQLRPMIAGSVENTIPELTRIEMNNAALPSLPVDGTHSYVMNVSVTRGGVTQTIPFNMPVAIPPLTGQVNFDKLSIYPLFWLIDGLTKVTGFENALDYFSADIMQTDNPTDILSAPTSWMFGHEEDEVTNSDITKITFTPGTPTNATEHDLYNHVFASIYPNGVTLVSYGFIERSLVDVAELSDDDTTFTFRLARDLKTIGKRTINPVTLESEQMLLPATTDMGLAANFGVTFQSPNAEVVLGVVDQIGTSIQPMFAYRKDSNGIYQPITFDWSGITGDKPRYFSVCTCSDDTNVIIGSGGDGYIAIALRQGTTNNYKVVKLYEPYTLDNLYSAHVLGNDRVLGRTYVQNGINFVLYELAVSFANNTAELIKRSEKEVTVVNELDDGHVMNHKVRIRGNFVLDYVREKIIWIDASNLDNIVTAEVGTADGYRVEPSSSGNGFSVSNVTLEIINGTTSKVIVATGYDFVYQVYVADINMTTGAITNKGQTTEILSLGWIYKYSNRHKVIGAVDTSGIERYYQVDSSNNLVPIELPLV